VREQQWAEKAALVDSASPSRPRSSTRRRLGSIDYTAVPWMGPTSPRVPVAQRVQTRLQQQPLAPARDPFAPPPVLLRLPEADLVGCGNAFVFMTDRALPRDYLVTPWKLLHLAAYCHARAYFQHIPGSQPFCTHPACTAARVADTLSHRFFACPVVSPVWHWVTVVLDRAFSDPAFTLCRDLALFNASTGVPQPPPSRQPL
jgi:hypothetical protein